MNSTSTAVQLAKALVAIPSASNTSNAQVATFLEDQLQRFGFTVERMAFVDGYGEKVSLVAKLGDGVGGLGFFSHSDTVPGDAERWEPFTPVELDGKLVGRGSCDMKGPLAATLIAASQIDATQLRRPLYIVVTADEEIGYGGAYQIVRDSVLLQENWPTQAVIAEPTRLRPVYAHKGGLQVYVTARGRAAHTSTEQGISANFLIAPFLAEMAELAPLFKRDPRFRNEEFDPPTNGFNMVIDDGNCRSNVTAAKTTVTLSLRTMPNDHRTEALQLIEERARQYNLEVTSRLFGPFYTAPDAELIRASLRATGLPKAETVPFGTEALVYQDYVAQQVILGPGDIAQAHTVGEWIDIRQLDQSVQVYRQLITELCCA